MDIDEAAQLGLNSLSVRVWDCTFYLMDDDGNDVLDEDGNVQIYDAPDLDWSYLADYVEIEDLVEIDDG